jgi:hypothetical protein
MPQMIVLTDGAANGAMTEMPAQEEVYRFADLIQEDDVRSVVINMEHATFDQGLVAQLAEHLGAPCYTLRELKAESLYQTVRTELDSTPQKKQPSTYWSRPSVGFRLTADRRLALRIPQAARAAVLTCLHHRSTIVTS